MTRIELARASVHIRCIRAYGPQWTVYEPPGGSIILWIRKEEPSGGGVDGHRRLGGREDGDGESREDRGGGDVGTYGSTSIYE